MNELLSIHDVQAALQAAGADPGGVDGIAGPKTYAAVKAFQQAQGLIVDGVIDWDVLEKLFPGYPWSSKLGERAMQIACTQVGVREATGKNDGLEVEAYLKAVGLGKGYSYCMAMIVWSVDQAAKGLGIHNPLVRTGGVMDQYRRYKGTIIDATAYTDIRPGDVGILDLGNDHGHTFFVRMAMPGQKVATVEGNTNDDGSANGNGDYFRERSIGSAKAFIRLD